jgi:hypothetical protein
MARLTMHSVNYCSSMIGDDTFCTDFFAPSRVGLPSLPGGGALQAKGVTARLLWGVGLALGLVTLLRLVLTCCKAQAGGALEEYCVPRRVGVFAWLSAGSAALAAIAGGVAQRTYASAVDAFLGAVGGAVGLEDAQDWAYESGLTCATAAAALNAVAALLFATAGVAARRAQARAQAEAAAAATAEQAAVAAAGGVYLGNASSSSSGSGSGSSSSGGGFFGNASSSGGGGFFPPPAFYPPPPSAGSQGFYYAPPHVNPGAHYAPVPSAPPAEGSFYAPPKVVGAVN